MLKYHLTELGRAFAPSVRPAGKLNLEDLPAALQPAVKAEPLAVRLLHAYGISAQHATLEGRSSAVYLQATSTGGNGRSCTFEGELKWDAGKSAWVNDDDTQPITWLILPDGIVLASPREEARQWCGPRAVWPAVYFIHAPD